MVVRSLLPVVLLVLLFRCGPVGSGAVPVGLLPVSDISENALSNGSSGEPGCNLHFSPDDSKVSL